jgi:predicted RNA-binding Zn-ribbon protein involved in translation (DUF1610 family)
MLAGAWDSRWTPFEYKRTWHPANEVSMKNTHKCPKCSGAEILRIEHKGVGIATGLTIFSIVPITRYLCAACGFSEEWINDPANIETLREKYGR